MTGIINIFRRTLIASEATLTVGTTMFRQLGDRKGTINGVIDSLKHQHGRRLRVIYHSVDGAHIAIRGNHYELATQKED